MHFHNDKLNNVAQDMRNNPTDAERMLWYNFLRGYSPRFQRQKSILRFVADFYCAKARLVIEIDGGYHSAEEQAEHDAARTELINKLDIKVIRFTNDDIVHNMEYVRNEINCTVDERLKSQINYSEGM